MESNRTEPPQSPPVPLARQLLPWLAGALVIWGLVAWVDRPAAEWGLANRGVEPWRSCHDVLAPVGSGTIQGILLILILAGALAFRKARVARIAGWLLLAFLLATALTWGVKRVVRRPRPDAMDAPRPVMRVQWDSSEWHSFPSGDVATTAALMAGLWVLLGRRREHRWMLLIPLLSVVQRLTAGRHFPSDVVAGYVLGAWVGAWVGARCQLGKASETEAAGLPDQGG